MEIPGIILLSAAASMWTQKVQEFLQDEDVKTETTVIDGNLVLVLSTATGKSTTLCVPPNKWQQGKK